MHGTASVKIPARADRPSEVLRQLISEVEKLPSSAPVLGSVLDCSNDPEASVRDLAQMCERDATLSAALLRTANSAFYGLSGRVGTVQFAVTVLGFSSVRSIVTTSMMDDSSVPSDWWQASAVQAVAAGHVAGHLDAASSDAFCAGLLSDLGRILLRRVDATQYTETCAAIDHLDDLPAAEVAWATMDHADVAATLFTHWRFPERIVEAVRSHHLPVEELNGDPLRLSVRAAHEVSSRMHGAPARIDISALTRGVLRESDVAGLADKVEADASDVLLALGR